MVYGVFLRTSFNTLAKPAALFRSFHKTSPAMIRVGEALPSAELTEGNPANKVNIKELCNGKKVVIFAVPGAFTPGCSKTHVPGYIKQYDILKSKGVDEIVCIAVNDPFVMNAWAKNQETEGKIRMLADADASFTKSLNLHIEIPPLGGIRSKRYSMIVEDGIVKHLNVEPDGTGFTCSLAEKLSF